MPDRTDRNFRCPPGPWPVVHDETRIFDHGAAWCANADGHPGFDIDYPDPIRHIPAYECRTSGLFVDASDGLAGRRCDVELYAARPFKFGELRSIAGHCADTRIVFDVFGQEARCERQLQCGPRRCNANCSAARIACPADRRRGSLRRVDRPLSRFLRHRALRVERCRAMKGHRWLTASC